MEHWHTNRLACTLPSRFFCLACADGVESPRELLQNCPDGQNSVGAGLSEDRSGVQQVATRSRTHPGPQARGTLHMETCLGVNPYLQQLCLRNRGSAYRHGWFRIRLFS